MSCGFKKFELDYMRSEEFKLYQTPALHSSLENKEYLKIFSCDCRETNAKRAQPNQILHLKVKKQYLQQRQKIMRRS